MTPANLNALEFDLTADSATVEEATDQRTVENPRTENPRAENTAAETIVADRVAAMPLALPAPINQEELAANAFERVKAHYEDGQYLDAYTASGALGDMRMWTGPEHRLMAARLSSCLGAGRVGRILMRLTHREHPDHARALFWEASTMLNRRGALATKAFMESVDQLPNADDATVAEWEALNARLFACFRDFQRSDQHIERALSLHPKPERVLIEKANLLFQQDRHQEALETTLSALELRPNFHVAVQMAAHYFVQTNEDDRALEFLHQHIMRMQSGYLLVQLADLETELELHDEAYQHLFQANDYLPLLEQDKCEVRWLSGRQSDAAYRVGEFDQAIEKAKHCQKGGFYEIIANRLSGAERSGRRTTLPVGFVRQHYHTCAPATLTSISQFWSKEVDHLDVVLDICYDGTPSHSERKWGNDQGYAVREFRVTWDSTIALIDRGVPFTLATYGTGMGHLQAVIGYDERRGTILIRDPSSRHTSEFSAEEFFEHAESYGPRGMVLVPADRSELLDGIDLPDAELFDVRYEMESALQAHDRPKAGMILEAMQTAAPDHRLTIEGRATLACYDSNDTEALECTCQLLERYPDDTNLLLRKLSLLGQLGRIQERRTLLEESVTKETCDPAIWIELCYELNDDAREETRLEELLQKTLRYSPTDAAALSCLAGLRWEQQRRDEAFELYRLATCSSDKNEAYAGTYFSAARFLQKTEEATQFLKDRKNRFGKQSTWPASTLARAYEGSGQVELALQTLEEAMSLHPSDGQFMLRVADMHAEYGKFRRSQEILVTAEKHCHQANWLRANGMLATYIGQQEAALQLWQMVLAAEPLAHDAHRQVAYLIAELKGREAAVDHVQRQFQKYPTNYPLGTLRVEWLREDPEQCEVALRELMQLHPDDPWVHRELGICLNAQRKWDAAIEVNKIAERLQPKTPVIHMINSDTAQGLGQIAAAKEACHQALAIDIDYEPAIEALMSMCDTKEERADELGFLLSEINRQSFQSDALFTFCRHASYVLEESELLGVLQSMLSNRPDQWQVWASLAMHLSSMEQHEDAKLLADEMIERFPLFPACWMYLSRIEAGRNNPAGQIDALERALAINPTWTVAARQLADVLIEQKQTEKAELLLRQAIAHQPNEAYNMGCLADLLWNHERRDEAIDLISRAVEVEPGYSWAWSALSNWGAELERPTLAIEQAQKLTEKRPNEPRSWFTLAEAYGDPCHRNERLAAIDRVLELNPRNEDAWSMRAWTLAQSNRFDEALANCRPEVFGGTVPLVLRAAEADMTCRLGESERAIELMEGVLEDDPDYYWAWERMFDWHEGLEKHENCKLAAEQLVRISPKCDEAWLRLGDAECLVESPRNSIAHYKKALMLNPECGQAVASLVATYLDLDDPNAAHETLDNGAEHFTDTGLLHWKIEINVKKKQCDDALELLKQICQMELESDQPIYQAVGPFMRAEMAKQAFDCLVGLVRNNAECSPHVAHVIVDIGMELGDLASLTLLLNSIDNSTETWANLAQHMVGCSSLASELWSWGEKITKAHRQAMHAHSRAWCAAGYLFEAQGKTKKLESWMDGWQKREDLAASMLLPLITRLWFVGQEKRAMKVLNEAHQLVEATQETLVWQAYCHFSQGEFATADQVLNQINIYELSNFAVGFYRMMTTVVVSALGQTDFAQARENLLQVNAERDSDDKELDRFFAYFSKQLKKIHRKTWFGRKRTA